MARIPNHPMRLARLEAGISQVQLAKLAGVNRAAVTAIEDGRTKTPSDTILAPLAVKLDIPVSVLKDRCITFSKEPLDIKAPPAVSNLMLIPPYTLNQYYPNFTAWRREIAKTPTALASMLRINPAVISRYEAGQLAGFPELLSRRLLEAFGSYGMTPEYVIELEKLPQS